MSDQPHSQAPVVPERVDPIPNAGISEMLGLLEILDDRQGKEKVYNLARDLNFDFGNLLLIIKAAEMLDFLHTPGTDVVLSSIGKKMIETEMNEKKKLLLNRLRHLSLFQFIKLKLLETSDQRMSKDDFLEMLRHILPKEPPEPLFQTVVNWGRWGEFLGYSQDDNHVYLDQG
jgi:NitT/TauT family transport system ATP-binding protein